MSNRGARMTKGQKETLIHYLEEHQIMLSPKVSPGDIPQVKQHWETLSNLLNSHVGAKKSFKQWKEAWNELKTNVRRKARENTYDIKVTGGGDKKAKELSKLEERIIGIISKIVIQGAPLPEAGVENENIEDLIVGNTEGLLEEHIVLPTTSSEAEFSTNTRPVLESEVQMNPSLQAQEEVRTSLRPRARNTTIRKRRNVTIHPMQQVVNTHGNCLHKVASSNEKLAEALLILGSSIAPVGKKNRHNAVFQLKF